MRTRVLLGLSCLLLAACGQWPDGASVDGGPGHVGVPALRDPGGPTPMRKLPSERNERTRVAPPEDRAGEPAVSYSAATGPTLDVEEAAGAHGERGQGVPAPEAPPTGATGGGTTSGGSTSGGTTTGGSASGDTPSEGTPPGGSPPGGTPPGGSPSGGTTSGGSTTPAADAGGPAPRGATTGSGATGGGAR